MDLNISNSIRLPSIKQITETLKDESITLAVHLSLGALFGGAYELSEYSLSKLKFSVPQYSFGKSIFSFPNFLTAGFIVYAGQRLTPYVFKHIGPIITTEIPLKKEIAAYLATSISIQAVILGLLTTVIPNLAPTTDNKIGIVACACALHYIKLVLQVSIIQHNVAQMLQMKKSS